MVKARVLLKDPGYIAVKSAWFHAVREKRMLVGLKVTKSDTSGFPGAKLHMILNSVYIHVVVSICDVKKRTSTYSITKGLRR
jgi:hypothetical protein